MTLFYWDTVYLPILHVPELVPALATFHEDTKGGHGLSVGFITPHKSQAGPDGLQERWGAFLLTNPLFLHGYDFSLHFSELSGSSVSKKSASESIALGKWASMAMMPYSQASSRTAFLRMPKLCCRRARSHLKFLPSLTNGEVTGEIPIHSKGSGLVIPTETTQWLGD